MAVLTLDPLHPTLDHHRPGEFPLFGTAMGIGALIEAAKGIGLCDDFCRIEAIRVHAPYICDHPGPHQLNVDIAPSGWSEVRSSPRSNGPDVLHFEGRIGQSGRRGSWRAPALGEFTKANRVDQARIYQAFFHGPAFQVVGTTWFRDPQLIARLADKAPTRHVPPVSRLIEFALQSAGLLELALSGRMLIPDAIDCIEIFAPVLKTLSDNHRPIFSHATQQAVTAVSSCSEISVWAHPDMLVARISGYRTVELPFPVASEPIVDLRRHLRGSSQ